MKERRIIHVIRTPSGDVTATTRGVSTEAAESWRSHGCEIFAFEVLLPINDVVDGLVVTAKRIDE